MTKFELEMLLTEKCRALDLQKIAFEKLEQIFRNNANKKDVLGGYLQEEIISVFERFEFHVDRRFGDSIVRTRIGLYIQDPNQIWLESMSPIGYYILDTDFNGAVIDDWFVIEKDKSYKVN